MRDSFQGTRAFYERPQHDVLGEQLHDDCVVLVRSLCLHRQPPRGGGGGSLALPPQMAMSDMSSPPIFKVPGLPMMKARKQARMAATPNKENSGDTSTDDEIPAAKSRQRKIVDPFPKDDNPGLSNSSSRKRKSSLAADMDYMGGLLDDARHITNWIPALKGRKMLVEGDLLDFK
jgi:hypothetical protein